MSFFITTAIALIAAYLLGSIPTGFWAGKLLRGIDIREHGSKSVGATNVLRTVGKLPALVVFLIDVLKGAAAIWLALWLYSTLASPDAAANVPWGVCLAGFAVIFGHSKSVWLGFAGGKSVATGLGVLLALSWPTGLTALAVFIVLLAIFRIVSLSSMSAALTASIVIWWLDHPFAYQLLILAGGIYVIVRHRANVGRLLAGNEPKIGQSSPQ